MGPTSVVPFELMRYVKAMSSILDVTRLRTLIFDAIEV